MSDEQIHALLKKNRFKYPLKKLWCLIAHRNKWRSFLDWDTGKKPIAILCDKCGRWHKVRA